MWGRYREGLLPWQLQHRSAATGLTLKCHLSAGCLSHRLITSALTIFATWRSLLSIYHLTVTAGRLPERLQQRQPCAVLAERRALHELLHRNRALVLLRALRMLRLVAGSNAVCCERLGSWLRQHQEAVQVEPGLVRALQT